MYIRDRRVERRRRWSSRGARSNPPPTACLANRGVLFFWFVICLLIYEHRRLLIYCWRSTESSQFSFLSSIVNDVISASHCVLLTSPPNIASNHFLFNRYACGVWPVLPTFFFSLAASRRRRSFVIASLYRAGPLRARSLPQPTSHLAPAPVPVAKNSTAV